MPPTIASLTVYTPCKDFALSQRFYAALGFTLRPGHGGTVDAELGGQRLRLQDYYVQDWAHNFMVVMLTPDVAAWHRHAAEVIAGGGFGDARLKAPEDVGGDSVLHVIDPSGVLLVFVQKRSDAA
jgi:hypothetical protein